ncbi:glycosyltransferase family 4 protein [uncultured Kocuria sp.]|uniref:glycosyltransferase family 4 protein n=1 Tax=uncultured Kocuria sp. TaxID=259305 RepID=UPI00262B4E51|nr:glycosyltransferase family 4 protein [uncultured Kocuria sp.]
MSEVRAGIDVVVPDDGGRPTGGSLYDRRLVAALDALGRPARLVPVAGDWPAPDGAARARLRRALGAPAPGRAVVLDGLVGCAAPETVDDAVRSGVPVHLLVHLPLPAETGLDPAIARELARREAAALAAATGVLTTSAWAARDVCRRYGTADAAVAEPGAERRPVAAGSSPPRLLCLASLTPRKNQRLLLRALAPLAGLDWTLDLVGPEGDPRHVHGLRAAVRELPDPGRVRCPGPLEGAALARQWARTDLLLLPSTAETYGMVVTEALAHGVPAVVAAGTGAVEALDGTPGPRGADGAGAPGAGSRAGAALDPADPSAWTEVLRDWLTDPALRGQWRAAALARRERLRGWEDTARDVLAAIGGPLELPDRPEHGADHDLDHDARDHDHGSGPDPDPDTDPDRTRRPT